MSTAANTATPATQVPEDAFVRARRDETPLQVLPGIVAAAKDVAVMIDGGFRRGTDVLIALALGARFVFIGRPFLFAAAVAGKPGVLHAIELLSKEIDRDMALLGLNRLDQLDREMLLDVRQSAVSNTAT